MFSEPLWEVRGRQGFQGPALEILPEGFRVPETKHLNILSNARQLLSASRSRVLCLCALLTSLLRQNMSLYNTFIDILLQCVLLTSRFLQNILILQRIKLKMCQMWQEKLYNWIPDDAAKSAFTTASKHRDEILFECVPVSFPLNWWCEPLSAAAVNNRRQIQFNSSGIFPFHMMSKFHDFLWKDNDVFCQIDQTDLQNVIRPKHRSLSDPLWMLLSLNIFVWSS